jgi:hypothetical protein
VYAVTSLFWGKPCIISYFKIRINNFCVVVAYMKTRGVDPKTNGLPRELERVKSAIGRSKEIVDRALAPKVDISAAKRFIRGGLWEPKDSEQREGSNKEKSDVSKPPPNKRMRFDDAGSPELNNAEK